MIYENDKQVIKEVFFYHLRRTDLLRTDCYRTKDTINHDSEIPSEFHFRHKHWKSHLVSELLQITPGNIFHAARDLINLLCTMINYNVTLSFKILIPQKVGWLDVASMFWICHSQIILYFDIKLIAWRFCTIYTTCKSINKILYTSLASKY